MCPVTVQLLVEAVSDTEELDIAVTLISYDSNIFTGISAGEWLSGQVQRCNYIKGSAICIGNWEIGGKF